MLVVLKVGNRVKAERERERGIMFVFSVCSMVSVRRKTGGMHGTFEVDTECGGIRFFLCYECKFNVINSPSHQGRQTSLLCVCVCEREREPKSSVWEPSSCIRVQQS